jgi:chemotaxis response regulator CheB
MARLPSKLSIREAAFTIAQDLKSAEHRDMPGSAIDTGFVDHILPPEAIAGKLEEIARGGERPKGETQSAGEQ